MNAIFPWTWDQVLEQLALFPANATRSIRQAEVGATKTISDRVKGKFDLHPERLIADAACDTEPPLGWPVDRKIAPLSERHFLRQQHVVFPQNGRNPVIRCDGNPDQS